MTTILAPKLNSILAEELFPARGVLGDSDAQEQVNSLKERLFLQASQNSTLFYVPISMVLAIFVVMLYLLTVYAANTTALLAISSASGLSISGLIWFAIRIARESSQMALVVAMAERLSSEDALVAMKAILQQQQTSSSGNSVENVAKGA